MTPPAITCRSDLADTQLNGFTASGELIVRITGVVGQYALGSEADHARVHHWEASPGAWRRIAAMINWAAMGYGCGGRA